MKSETLQDTNECSDGLSPECEKESEEDHTEEINIQKLQAQIKELEEANIRTHADFENTKKRLEKEKMQSLEYAYESFAKEILPVIDSLEAAINSVNSSCLDEDLKAKFKEGLDLTLENFRKVLERYGIVTIQAQGAFDPYLHNAISHEESQEHDDGEIIQVLQKGYRYKERILRPALVKICKK